MMTPSSEFCPPNPPSPACAKPQKVPTAIYAIAFIILFIKQVASATQEGEHLAGNPAFAFGYVLGHAVWPPILAAAIASIWRANRGFRGVVRVLCVFSLVCLVLEFVGEEETKATLWIKAHRLPQRVDSAAAAKPSAATVIGTLSAADKAALFKDAGTTQSAVDRMDVDAMIKHLPEAIFRFYGKEKVLQAAAQVMPKVEDAKFLISDFHEPSKTYQTTKELICFLPRISVIRVHSRKVQYTAYWVAVRETGDLEWKFIDGSAFQGENAQFLWKLYPELPVNIQLPDWKMEPTH